jgi:hypothetical protein
MIRLNRKNKNKKKKHKRRRREKIGGVCKPPQRREEMGERCVIYGGVGGRVELRTLYTTFYLLRYLQKIT